MKDYAARRPRIKMATTARDREYRYRANVQLAISAVIAVALVASAYLLG